MGHAGGASCGFTGGGNGAPDVVYDYVAPAAGIYDVRIRDAGYDAYLYVRGDSCLPQEPELGCDPGNGTADPQVTLTMEQGQRIAIVVDGESPRGGMFTLSVHRRQADLVVKSIAAPATTQAGSQVQVSAEIVNQGDGDAGPFRVEFFYAQDATLAQPVSLSPLICEVSGLRAGETVSCTPPNPLGVQLVAPGQYAIGVRVDATNGVDEYAAGNNTFAQPTTITAAPGVVLEQQVFRAADGTVYQLIQAVPVLRPTDEGRFQITTLAASSGTVTTCKQDGAKSGDPLQAAAGSTAVVDLSTITRTGILRPNSFGLPQFDERDGGRLELGATDGVLEVCGRGLCNGEPLVALTEASGGVPAACVATGAASLCKAALAPSAIRFEPAVAGEVCTDPAATIAASTKCDGAATLMNGLTLQPGEAVVFVYAPGREAFEVGLGAFGVTAAVRGGCGVDQVVSPKEQHDAVERVPFLSFTQQLLKPPSTAITFSPDGRQAYVVGDTFLSVLLQNVVTGRLERVQQLRNGVEGVRGLAGAQSVTTSPDGAYIYVASAFDSAVAVFRHDAKTGTLTFVQAEQNGVGGVHGLNGAFSVTVSPDGGNVYVASFVDSAVVVFQRDPTSGALTFVEAMQNGGGSGFNLDGASSVAVSPEGNHVYVASDLVNDVVVFRRDATSGTLAFVEVAAGGGGSVTVSPDGANVYVGLAAFQRDRASGALSFVGYPEESGGVVGGSATVSRDGANVYVAELGALAVFHRDRASGALSFFEAHESEVSVGGSEAFDGVGAVALSPNGSHVYMVSGADDTVAVFQRDGTSGALSCIDVGNDVNSVEGLDGAFSVAVSPDGGHVYVASAIDGALVVFRRDATTGALTFVEAQRNGVNGVDGLDGAFSVTVSPDGDHVYVASSFPGAVAVFQRDAVTGALTFVEGHRNGTGGADGLAGARSVAVSPGGGNVYVASFLDNAVAVFRRTATTGTLTFVEAEKNGIGGVNGIAGAESVAVSPDGSHVYVAGLGFAGGGIAVFRRNATSGALTFVDADELIGAEALTVSPDGGNVYAVSVVDGTLAVFQRDATTGVLSLVETEQNGSKVQGLNGAASVTLSPDGSHAYVTGYVDGALAVFRRDPTSGTLSFVEAERNGFDGVYGLDGAQSVAVSPDGTNVYVASDLAGTASVFRVIE